MDVFLLASLVAGLVVLLIILALFSRKKSDESEANVRGRPQPQAQGQHPRRAAGVRNARQRLRGNAAAAAVARRGNESDDSNDEGNEEDGDADVELADGKLGAKKRAKLEAKAERKVQREAAEREREERRKREQLLQEERDKQSEKEKLEEARQEEAEKKAREEKERREYEEYVKMKEAFSVEEEGYQEGEDAEEENLLQKFVDHIKENKVVVLEDLAAQFRMKTVDVIDRIQNLQADGSLTGVVDDRGKFIYISVEELEAVAKFIRQSGRVSITELAENSNILINLNPSKSSALNV